MLLEIRNIVQRSLERRKRWFHDDDFDLYVWQAHPGRCWNCSCVTNAARATNAP